MALQVQVPAVWQRALSFITRSGELVAVIGELITAKLTWKNYTLDEGTSVTLVVVPAVYDEATDSYVSITYEVDGVKWIFAVSITDTAPAKDTEKTTSLPTVAYVTIAGYPVMSAFGAVGSEITFTVHKYKDRIVGINPDQIADWWGKAFATKFFPDVLQIVPAYAEPTGLEFVKG